MVHAMCLLAEHIDNNTPVEEKMQVFFFVLFKRQYGNIVSMLYQSANAALMRCKYRRAQYEKNALAEAICQETFHSGRG